MAKGKNSSFRLTCTVNLVGTASVWDRHVLPMKYAFISDFSNPLKSAVIPCVKQINWGSATTQMKPRPQGPIGSDITPHSKAGLPWEEHTQKPVCVPSIFVRVREKWVLQNSNFYKEITTSPHTGLICFHNQESNRPLVSVTERLSFNQIKLGPK